MFRARLRSALGLLLVAGLALSAAACGSDDAAATTPRSATARSPSSINGLPPATEEANHERFLDNVAAFEKANPNIKIDAREGKMDPQTFPAKLAGGQLEDVFYVYFTDPASLIAKRQVADITPVPQGLPGHRADQARADEGLPGRRAARSYGLPCDELLAGPALQPRRCSPRPASTRTTRRRPGPRSATAAKKIAALGDGNVGYGDYSKSNTGGWHFTAELYSIGGDVATKDGDTWKAAFNNDKGKQVLQQLKDMRWTDNSMGEQAAARVGRPAADDGLRQARHVRRRPPDNIPTIVNQYKGNFDDYGLGPIPDGQGTLGGGEGYMFNAKADARRRSTPA